MNTFYKIVSYATSSLFFYLFVQLFFESDSFVRGAGLEPSLATLVLGRRAAIFMLGISLLMYYAKNISSSEARRIICISTGMTLFGLSCLSGYDYFRGTVNSTFLFAMSVETILWVSYLIIILKDRKTKTVQ
jgi:hypothetical protein